MTLLQKICTGLILFGIVGCTALAGLHVPFGDPYVLPGSLFGIGLIGIIATWGEEG